MSITIGQKAPDFKLFDTEKKEVSLQDFNGKNLLILFFPLAFSGVCTKELCSVRDDIGSYSNMNSEVIGISIDSLFSLNKFKADQNLSFPLLSDFNKTVSASYGSLSENFAFGYIGVTTRSAFIVDKNGIIQYAEICPTPGDLPNFEAIKTCLQSLA